MLRVTPHAVISEPRLLAPGFQGASWDRWRALLKAMFGEALDNQERQLFCEVAERTPPTKPVKEAWLLVGRRGGKDSIAAAIAVTMSLTDHKKYLRPGEVGVIACLAVTREQAAIVLKYITAAILENEYLAPLVTQDGIQLSNGVEILVLSSRFRSLRGRTVLYCIMDEVAYWRSEDAADPDYEIYNAVKPATVTLSDAMIIGITTFYRKQGLAFDRWARYYGQDDPDVLVVKATSRQFNPLISQKFIDEQLALDPEVNGAEYLSQWRSDLAAYVSREIVESAVVAGRYELPPRPDIQYMGFCDPAGGSGADSMTLGIAHCEGASAELRVLDCIREWRPQFSPDAVVREAAETLLRYGVTTVTGDRYAGDWPGERFREYGVEYLSSERPKTDIYKEFLPLLNSGRAALLDNQRLVSQLIGLERRTTRGSGRDVIDHAANAHDDISNAAAGALVLSEISRSLLAWRGMI